MSRRYGQFDNGFDQEPTRPGMPWALAGFSVAVILGLLIAAGTGGPRRCSGIADDASRLACFDAAASPQPAKGAPIPNH